MGQLVLWDRRVFLLTDLDRLKLVSVFQTLKHFNILLETGVIVILLCQHLSQSIHWILDNRSVLE